MTNAELKKKIAESPSSEWYKNVSETFNFDYINTILSFKGISAVYEYVNQQINGWSQHENLPNELENSKSYFQNVKSQIVRFFDNYYNREEGNLDNYWNEVRRHINNTQSLPLPYSSPQAEFLLKIYNENPKYFLGAFSCIAANNISTNNKQNFFGSLLAYEFILKDNSEIVERRNTEKNSINKIRIDFQNYLNNSEELLITHLKNANDKYTEYSKKIDDLETKKESDFNFWFNETIKKSGKNGMNQHYKKLKN